MRILLCLLLSFFYLSTSQARTADSDITPLMQALLDGDTKAVQKLLSQKVPLEVRNKAGDTALAVAVTNEQYALAAQLIQAGAKVDIVVAGEEQDPLLVRAAGNDLKITRLIVQKNKSLLNKTNKEGDSALMNAVRFGMNDVVAFLLKQGANHSLKNKKGQTALDLAREFHNEEALALLKKK
ncbi:MAG: ankyrin repeat domain-containing protein [Bdellovibrio sp.]